MSFSRLEILLNQHYIYYQNVLKSHKSRRNTMSVNLGLLRSQNSAKHCTLSRRFADRPHAGVFGVPHARDRGRMIRLNILILCHTLNMSRRISIMAPLGSIYTSPRALWSGWNARSKTLLLPTFQPSIQPRCNNSTTASRGPLYGVKILDLTRVLAVRD